MCGAKTRRWVLQTDFANDEAVGFLADRLAKLGVEEALAKAGAVPGDAVVIGDEADAGGVRLAPDRPDRQHPRPAWHRPTACG